MLLKNNIKSASPKIPKKKIKSAEPKSADLLENSPVHQILTSKSEVNTSSISPPNKSPIPTLEPLPEESESKRVKKKRKAAQSLDAVNHNPGHPATDVKADIDSISPKRLKKQESQTKAESSKAPGNNKSDLKDSKIVPFSEIVRTRFPLLTDNELVKQFQSVTMTNNQKGRIRLTLKGIFEGTTTDMLPDIIYNKIQYILQSKQTLTDSDLRKIRVLYNMLKVATEIEMKNAGRCSLPSKLKKDIVITRQDLDSSVEVKPAQKKEVQVSKNRRYVVFIGNLPLDVNKDQLISHFDELRPYVKDVRIPPPKEGKKSAIAYLELLTEPAFEMALSKHHTMFCNRRINVLYSKQQNSKMSKEEAKAKAAKMVALVKSGQLIGSLPMKKKRSHRRAIMKQAQKEANDKALTIKGQ